MAAVGDRRGVDSDREGGRPTRGPSLAPAELAALLQRIPDVVWRYRLVPARGFEYVSPSVFALTGFTPAEHYADPDLGRRIVHPDDAPLVEAVLASPGGHDTLTLRWRHRDGHVFATEQRITALRDRSGHVTVLEGVGRPVIDTDRRSQLPAGDLVLDLATSRVLVAGRVVDLTPTEHRILALLASSEDPVAPAAIVTRLWGQAHAGGARVVQVHVSNLRRKIEDDPRRPRRLLTARGVGYLLAQ